MRPATCADQIRARGFRKWYERQLVDSHLHLITAFLCLIAVLGAVEQLGPYTSFWPALYLFGVTLVLGALGAWCLVGSPGTELEFAL